MLQVLFGDAELREQQAQRAETGLFLHTMFCAPRHRWCRRRSGTGFIAVYCGVWRSPVARLLWEQEVPGSNPGAPMKSLHGPRVACDEWAFQFRRDHASPPLDLARCEPDCSHAGACPHTGAAVPAHPLAG